MVENVRGCALEEMADDEPGQLQLLVPAVARVFPEPVYT
jgi:hypothetical protein